MEKAKVIICIPTLEYARRADFYDYVNMIHKEGPDIESVGLMYAHGQSPARNRNTMIEASLANGFTHILFLDDDVVPRPDIIHKLLAHDKDIVSGIYLMRTHPHFPVLFDESYKDGKCKFTFLEDGKKGLIEIVNCGLGAALIKTSVFERMKTHPVTGESELPWIRLGQCVKDHWADDTDFFNRARMIFGYKMYADLDCPVGHMLSATIFPNLDLNTGKWYTAATFDGVHMHAIPQYIPTKEEIVESRKNEGVVEEPANGAD